jgi:hypothetical protein
MSESIQPSIPPIPPQASNIASLANPSTLSNLKDSLSPSTFGDQIKDKAKQQVIKAATESTIAKLYKEKADLIEEGILLDINHQKTLFKLQQDNTPAKKVVDGQTVDIPPKLSNEEYAAAVTIENINYELAKKNLQERKDQNQKSIDDYLKDPFKKQKDEAKKIKERLNKRKTKTKAEKAKARKALAKTVLQNAKKTLVPIITLLLTNKIAEIVANNNKIGKLVDDTNAIIIDANQSGDPTKLNNAKLARDNAIRIIQSNEDKIRKIEKQIEQIGKYINIFSIIVAIISAIPIPTSVPPGIGIPVNLIITLVKILEKANKIILALSALIPIIITILDKAISILEDYKAQLLNINGILEKASADGTNPSLLNTNGANGDGSNYGEVQTGYKGFKFAIREDNSFGVHVGQYKRHYAVAIDKYNVDVLKSELSFTLDPNDLIEQLKLVIDQQNLIA